MLNDFADFLMIVLLRLQLILYIKFIYPGKTTNDEISKTFSDATK